MLHSLRIRIILNILLALSILLFPWWVSLAWLLILIALFRAYEVLLWALIIDVLYGSAIPLLFGFEYVVTAGALFLFILAETIKKRLVFY